jgi:hypothetical protein
MFVFFKILDYDHAKGFARERGIIKYIDINWTEAKDNEKVVGFGLGSQGNRLVPYLVTIPR